MTADDLRAFALRAGFSQVGDGVLEELNAFLANNLDSVVGQSMLKADADKERTLGTSRAIQGITRTPTLVNGHYQ